MRKYLRFLLVTLTVITAATTAHAERGRKTVSAPPDIPRSEAVTKLVAEEQPPWGSNHQAVVAFYSKQIRKAYAPVLAKISDAIREDRERREMNNRIKKVADSFVEFNGQRTGWDSSFLRNHFTHNNHESLVAVPQVRASDADARYTDFFFFIGDKLWCRYRAFNQDAFGNIPFDQAAESFEKYFGSAKQVRDDAGGLVRLVWQDGATKLEAVDNTRFYGFFSLVFTDMATESKLADLRANRPDNSKSGGVYSLLNQVENASESDQNANVVENITGKRYKTSQPQEPVGNDRGTKGPAKVEPTKNKTPPSVFDEPSSPSKNSGNPLDILDI